MVYYHGLFFYLYIFVVLFVYCHSVMNFFIYFSLVYICVIYLFVTQVIYFFKLSFVMVINSKLVIGYEILKIIPTQNQSYRTLYTAPNCTCDWKIEMLCSDGFNQTAPQSAVLKMTQNCTTNTPSYQYLNVFRNYLLINSVGTVHPL